MIASPDCVFAVRGSCLNVNDRTVTLRLPHFI